MRNAECEVRSERWRDSGEGKGKCGVRLTACGGRN